MRDVWHQEAVPLKEGPCDLGHGGALCEGLLQKVGLPVALLLGWECSACGIVITRETLPDLEQAHSEPPGSDPSTWQWEGDRTCACG